MSVLVTGGAAGIGAAISEVFVQAAYALAVTDIDGEAAQAKAKDLGALGARLDVLDRESIRSAAERRERELGSLHAWMSNVGVSTMGRFTERIRVARDSGGHAELSAVYAGSLYKIPRGQDVLFDGLPRSSLACWVRRD